MTTDLERQARELLIKATKRRGTEISAVLAGMRWAAELLIDYGRHLPLFRDNMPITRARIDAALRAARESKEKA